MLYDGNANEKKLSLVCLKMPMKKYVKIVKELGFFIPFSIYLLVFVALTGMGYTWLKKSITLPESSYIDVYRLLLSVALATGVAIICFGLITTLMSFLFFRIKKNQNKINFSFQHAPENNDQGRTQMIKLKIEPILLPFLGFLRIRILYDNDKVSKKYALIAGKKKFNSLSYNGEFSWSLPEIREYQIEKIIIYFEDLFQFFSFAVSVHSANRFHINPVDQKIKELNANPNKTEDDSIRIEKLKRVDGELINYKNFENNDDVRRIVWKIYAKNKELVVRIPEILNPYASHIYLYTSFFTKFNVSGSELVETFFLNHYKTICWSIFKQLNSKGFEVKHIPDQLISPISLSNKEALTKYALTTSKWQNNNNIKDYLNTSNVSVLVISSLSDPDEISAFTTQLNTSVSIIYISLTESLEQNIYKDWVKWLFIENESNHISSYKTQWNLSPLRIKVIENEKKLKEIMNQISHSTIL
jgi:hypothetical protein